MTKDDKVSLKEPDFYLSKLRKKNQLTIPEEIRKAMGMKYGDYANFSIIGTNPPRVLMTLIDTQSLGEEALAIFKKVQQLEGSE